MCLSNAAPFLSGKDLSSRSESDLNCIFGKRPKSVKDQEQVRDMKRRRISVYKTENIQKSLLSLLVCLFK